MNRRFSPASQVTIASSGQRQVQLADQAARLDRRLVRARRLDVPRSQALVGLGDPPRAPAVVGDAGVLRRFQQLRQDRLRVAEHRLGDRERPGGVARLDVDLDDRLALRIEQRAVLERGVGRAELGADRQDEVGLGHHGVGGLQPERPEDAERERVGVREDALAGGGRGDRRAEVLGEGAELGAGARDPHAVAGHDQRSLGGGEHPDGALHLGGGRGLARLVLARREVRGRLVQARRRVRTDRRAERGAVVEHGDRPAVAGQGVLDGELGLLDGLAGLTGDEDLLGVAGDRAPRVPGAVVGGAGLVRAVMGERRIVAQVREDQHRRAGQEALDDAHAGVGQHEGGLPHHHAGLAGQPAVDVRHDGAEPLLADEHGADRVLVVVERVEDPAGAAARHPEDVVDPGLFEDPDDGLWNGDVVIEQPLRRHRVALPVGHPLRCPVPGR